MSRQDPAPSSSSQSPATRMSTGEHRGRMNGEGGVKLKKEDRCETSGHVTHLSSSCVRLCHRCGPQVSSAGANSEILPLPLETTGRCPSGARPRGRERPPLDRQSLSPCPRHLHHCRQLSRRRSLSWPQQQRSRSLTLKQQQSAG